MVRSELDFIAVFGEARRESHNTRIADEKVESLALREELFGTGLDAGE